MSHAQRGPAADAGGRERLVDAAIACFARDGFGASVRQIASAAGVTAGLITHHFGSKDALRAACDTEVLHRITDLKRDGIRRAPAQQLAMIAELDVHGTTLVYVLRSLREGGDAGRAFLQRFQDDARGYLGEALAAGLVKPSADEEARLRYLTTTQLGGLLMEAMVDGDAAFTDPTAFIHRLTARTALPTVELYTQGLLTNDELLRQYLAAHPEIAGNRSAHPGTSKEN